MGRAPWPIDGATKRRLAVKVELYKATLVLMFAGYGEGDARPDGEKLVAGKSVVTRLVADGDREDLYFDSDVKLAGLDATRPSRPCVPE